MAAKSYPEAAPVQVMNLVKEFSGGKVAVNNVSLVIEDKMCFGLLGPNGGALRRACVGPWFRIVVALTPPGAAAGKTTLISTLTGLHSVSRGTATIGGYDIRSQMSSIYQVIGICPQFDVRVGVVAWCVGCIVFNRYVSATATPQIHFPSLSVREHLLLYARLKGVNPANEAALIEAMIQGVGLCTSRLLCRVFIVSTCRDTWCGLCVMCSREGRCRKQGALRWNEATLIVWHGVGWQSPCGKSSSHRLLWLYPAYTCRCLTHCLAHGLSCSWTNPAQG